MSNKNTSNHNQAINNSRNIQPEHVDNNAPVANTLKANESQEVEMNLEITDNLTDEQKSQITTKILANKDVVEEVLKAGKLQGIKTSLRKREWIDIVGAGLIAGAAVGASMVVANKMTVEAEGDDTETFTTKEIAVMTGVAAVSATALRGALDFIPAVNRSPSMGLLVTSLCANAVVVGASVGHEKILGLVNGKVSVDVEALAEEA